MKRLILAIAVVVTTAVVACSPNMAPNYNRCAAGVWCGDDDAGVDAGCLEDDDADAGVVNG